MEYNNLLTGVKNLKVRWEFSASTSAAKSKYWNNRDKVKLLKPHAFLDVKLTLISIYL